MTGRFAPSPTGPLHMGSLLTAVASFVDARVDGGRWFVRIDDLDTPRNIAGAEQQILDSLAAHGLQWDQMVRQSERLALYETAAARLIDAGLTFRCRCSRKSLIGQAVYPGNCRDLALEDSDSAVRLRVDDRTVACNDLLQDRYEQRLSTDVGDFIIIRRDGQFSYQLTNIVDEADMGITRVLRGADLLENTPRQIYIGQLLKLPIPQFIHLPVIVERGGHKISKQTFAKPADPNFARDNLSAILDLLNLSARSVSRNWSVADLLTAAIDLYAHRRESGLPRGTQLDTWISI